MSMTNWLYKKLMNRPEIGPKMHPKTCQIPGCTEPAKDQWFPSVCALRDAGVRVDWVAVCFEHDAQANEITVRHFYGDKYEAELSKYREKAGGLDG